MKCPSLGDTIEHTDGYGVSRVGNVVQILSGQFIYQPHDGDLTQRFCLFGERWKTLQKTDDLPPKPLKKSRAKSKKAPPAESSSLTKRPRAERNSTPKRVTKSALSTRFGRPPK